MKRPEPERVCSRCQIFPRKPGQRWCRRCHARYMREWRARKKAEA